MKKFKRVFLIVLDSLGVGALPDAADFGDEGSDTLRSVMSSPKCHIPLLTQMGLAATSEISWVQTHIAAAGKAVEMSRGKDTTVGHWEICGVISEKPLPVYPEGFPENIIAEFSRRTGCGILCNRPYSGTDVIADYGEEHCKSGKLIVYTSADSVFQIAAHENVVSVDKLYEYCIIAREILCGENAVGRVIARPFDGEYPNFRRTSRRHDFSLEPPKETLLDRLSKSGYDVISVGKIYDIFAGRGITRSYPTVSNDNGMEITEEILHRDFNGLCFTNLVDFDTLYGHRNDTDGYAAALTKFDTWLGNFIPQLKDDDMLIITADHGCDPATHSTDHSREYVPIIVYGSGIKPINLNTRETYADISASISENFEISSETGKSFLNNVSSLDAEEYADFCNKG